MGARHEERLDGGRAWADCTLAGVAMFTVFVSAYSFGTFVRPIAAEFDADRSATALVFGITTFAYFMLGIVTGPMVRRVGPRRMVLAGGAVQVVGLLVTSRVTAIWQAYVTFGIGVGVGVACCYVPLVAVVGGWFERRRATAVGLAVAGIGFSSLLGAPIAAALIEAHGWRTAYVILAAGTAVLLAAVALGIRTPPSFSVAPATTLSAAVRTPTFALLYGALVFCAIPLFNVFVNIVPSAEEAGMAKVRAATLVSIVGGASVAGRIGIAALARRIGPGPTFVSCFATMTVTQFIWLAADGRYAVLAVFALMFGVAYGGFIAVSPILLAEIFGVEHMGGITGANYSAAGVGALFGPTIGAWLVDRSDGYTAAIVLGTVCGAIGTALLVTAVLRERRIGARRQSAAAGVAGPA